VSAALEAGAAKLVWHGKNAEDVIAGERLPNSIELEHLPAIDKTSLLCQFGQTADQYAGVDLLEGGFGKGRGWMPSWPTWRRSIVLGVAASFLAVLLTVSQALQMNRQAEAMDALAGERMRGAVPGVRNLSHLRAKIRQMKSKESDQFLYLSSLVFGAVGRTSSVSVSKMEYDQEYKRLKVKFAASNLPAIDRLKQDLAQAADVNISQTNSRQNGVHFEADLSLEVGS